MNVFNKRTLRTIETPDEIQFLLVRRLGWISSLLVSIFATLLVWQSVSSPEFLLLFGAGILALIAFINLLGSKRTLLEVTRYQITAHGDLGQSFNEYLQLEPSSIRSIGYSAGVQQEHPSGLYATQGWSEHCLMPGLNEVECQQIVDAIYRKFPDIPIGGRDGGSLFFDEDGGIIRLGLGEQ